MVLRVSGVKGSGMLRVVLGACAAADPVVGPAPADKAPSAAPAAKTPAPSDGLGPVLMGTGDLKLPPKKPGEGPAVKPPPPIIVDEKTRTVRAAVTFTRTKGVVEWVLSAARKHPAASVMVAENSAKEFAAALARAGYDTGTPPASYADDKIRLPAGQPLEVEVIVTRADGKVDRIPAQRFISTKSAGDPVSGGSWIYVGPQAIREGDADILVTELSGSVITTNLRDSSAMIFWLPRAVEESPAAPTYYASSAPLPGEADRSEIEIRPAAPAASPPAK